MRTRGTGRVYRPKNCRFWYFQYWQDGKQFRVSSHSTLKSGAEMKLRAALHSRDTGRMPVQEQRKITYADIRAGLLDSYATLKRKSLQAVADDASETVWGLSPLDRFFGYPKRKVLAVDISNKTAQDFIRTRREEGVSDATIRGSLALLKRMLRIAVAERKLEVVPMLTLPPAPPAKDDFIREDQLHSLLAELPERAHPFIIFLFYQGTRSGEASDIRWHQIDLAKRTYAPDALKNKTGDARFRALHPAVVECLRALRGDASGGDPVFDTTNGFKSFRRVCFKLKLGRKAWQCNNCRGEANGTAKTKPAPVCSNPDCPCNGVPMKYEYTGLTLHGLRRSCVVYYREHGMSDGEIRRITGHQSLEVFNAYNVIDLRAQQAAMQRVLAASLGQSTGQSRMLPAPRHRN